MQFRVSGSSGAEWSSCRKLCHHSASSATCICVMYSVLVLDSATTCCFFKLHKMAPALRHEASMPLACQEQAGFGIQPSNEVTCTPHSLSHATSHNLNTTLVYRYSCFTFIHFPFLRHYLPTLISSMHQHLGLNLLSGNPAPSSWPHLPSLPSSQLPQPSLPGLHQLSGQPHQQEQ